MLISGSEKGLILLEQLMLPVSLSDPFPATVTRRLLTSHPISFAGYIIGLGDWHGSNILVDQLTWGALHIDFGDVGSLPQRTVQKMINSGPAIQRCPREVLFA